MSPPVLVRSPALEENLHAPVVGEGFLHTSPEFALKRVLAAGLCRIYAVSPCFREEEWGPLHTREFTMVEWYRVGAGYLELMEDVEDLIQYCGTQMGVPLPGFERHRYADLFERFTGSPAPVDAVERQRVWINEIEKQLQSPTFVYDYPADEAAFSEIRGSVAERFELFFQGVELANAFSELRDPEELRQRWDRNNTARVKDSRAPHPVDERVIEAVSTHPRAAGIALGFDRLLYVLCNLSDIRQGQIPG